MSVGCGCWLWLIWIGCVGYVVEWVCVFSLEVVDDWWNVFYGVVLVCCVVVVVDVVWGWEGWCWNDVIC